MSLVENPLEPNQDSLSEGFPAFDQIHHCYLDVRGYEIDSFGHVNNAIYYNYFEYARWLLMETKEKAPVEVNVLETIHPVVRSAEIRFRRPARVGDRLKITTKMDGLSPVKIVLRQEILRQEQVVASALMTIAFIEQTGRPVLVPNYFKQLFATSNTTLKK